MSANFVGMVFGAIGVVTAFFLLPRKVHGADTVWGFILWLLALPLLFFIYDPLWIFAIMAVLLLCLAPITPARRAAFFIVAVPCLPFYLSAEFPFPGINQLLILTHYKVVASTRKPISGPFLPGSPITRSTDRRGAHPSRAFHYLIESPGIPVWRKS